MDFPQYRKAITEDGRGGYPTKQFFKFLSERSTLNVRIDNVKSIGYAPEMPEVVAETMLSKWQISTVEEFLAAFAEAYAELVEHLDG